jgi:phage gpG-like protein
MATGVEDLENALRRLIEQADDAAKAAAQAAAVVMDRGVKLELSRSSHAPGTKTPASPGLPPSLITGRLRQSVRMTKLWQSGVHQWTSNVGGTVVYARIQELGGNAGRGHKSHLPPRPYIRPAQLKWSLTARDAAISAFINASGLSK